MKNTNKNERRDESQMSAAKSVDLNRLVPLVRLLDRCIAIIGMALVLIPFGLHGLGEIPLPSPIFLIGFPMTYYGIMGYSSNILEGKIRRLEMSKR